MDFDRAAQTYDTDFTDSSIGRWQRNSVLNHMDSILDKSSDLKILELNAGTGEDAIYFASKGHEVTATDISTKMVAEAEKKVKKSGLSKRVNILQCDIKSIANYGLRMEYDIVFSNFGGLNCLSPLEIEKLCDDIMFVLKPGGRFIAVVMPRFCFWESFYFLTKLKTTEAFRRNTQKSLAVSVAGSIVKTWYYGPGQFNKLMRPNFRRIKLRPIGFLVPPSYLGPAFEKRKRLLDLLGKIDSNLAGITLLANFSDHFLMDLERVK